jgi:hypothetical protein
LIGPSASTAIVEHRVEDGAHLGAAVAGQQHRRRRAEPGVALPGGQKLHFLGRTVGRLQRHLDVFVLEEAEMLRNEICPCLGRGRGLLAKHQRELIGRVSLRGSRDHTGQRNHSDHRSAKHNALPAAGCGPGYLPRLSTPADMKSRHRKSCRGRFSACAAA